MCIRDSVDLVTGPVIPLADRVAELETCVEEVPLDRFVQASSLLAPLGLRVIFKLWFGFACPVTCWLFSKPGPLVGVTLDSAQLDPLWLARVMGGKSRRGAERVHARHCTIHQATRYLSHVATYSRASN